MAANIIIQSNLSGFGSAPLAPPRTEVSYDTWVSNTDEAWANANPGTFQAFAIKGQKPAAIGGVAAAAVGALVYATGSKKVGAALGIVGVIGIGLSVAYRFMSQGQSSLVVGSRPGWMMEK